MSTIAVTGATGNLGGLVIDHLLTLGVPAGDIVPFVRSEEKGAAFAARDMAPRVASYDDPESFERALDGIDKLVLISPPSFPNELRLHQLHGAVMAATRANLTQLAWVSLSDPEQRAFGLEDVDLAIEHSILAAGIPYTFLRDSTYLDELGPELRVAAKSGELLSISGDGKLNWAPRANQAKAIASAVVQDGHLGKTYNLVAPEHYTYDDVARVLSEATGTQIVHRTAPADEVIDALTAGGMDAEHAESMVTYFQTSIATGKCRTVSDDIELLAGVSGRPTPEYFSLLLKRDAH